MSPIFKNVNGYRFSIFSNEEKRMHVHVFKDNHHAKIWLEPIVELAENKGFTEKELSNIIKIIKKMKTVSKQSIEPISVSVRSILPDGIFLSVYGKDYYLSYNRLPWFRDAKTSDIFNVSMMGDDAVRWESLDVDLEIDSLLHPEKYPLVMKRSLNEVF